MGIVNRRNALVGWVVLKVGKRVARQKAKSVVPEQPGKAGAALAAVLAAAAGVAAFLRRRGSSQ
jgi:hypothetical protein